MKERSLKARALGKTLVKDGKSYQRGRISKSEMGKFGGKDNWLGCFEDFYFNFMTDPFLNTLFDFTHKDTVEDHKTHGKRLGLFFLAFFGDDDEYYELRTGHPVGNLNKAHNRAKGCPMRGKYAGYGFTEN